MCALGLSCEGINSAMHDSLMHCLHDINECALMHAQYYVYIEIYLEMSDLKSFSLKLECVNKSSKLHMHMQSSLCMCAHAACQILRKACTLFLVMLDPKPTC